MAIRENAYIKLPGELKRKRKFFNRPAVYWFIALFFLWLPILFLSFIGIMNSLDKFIGAKDPTCPFFFIPYAILGPVAAFILVKKTQRSTSLLWAVFNAAICPFVLILWLFALTR